MKTLLLSWLIALAISGQGLAQGPAADAIVGTWLTQDGNLRVKITRVGSRYQGLIVWLKEPNENGHPKRDQFNPDPALRSNPVLGKTLILDRLTYDGAGSWKGGTIYDSRNGKVYDCKLTLKDDDHLNVRGFVGVSLLGQTNEWRRIE